MKLVKLPTLLLMAVVLLAACTPVTPGPESEAPPTQVPDVPTPTLLPPTPYENQVPVPAAVLAAQQDLAKRLGTTADRIQIREISEEEWTNGCLDLPQPGEACTEALVPGFRAVFTVDGQTYEYHTNRDGTLLRIVE